MYNATDAITRCNPCPRGHSCSSKTAHPVPCTEGYYQNQEGQTSCTICPAGSACPFPHESPVSCPYTTGNTLTGAVHGWTSNKGATWCYPVWGSCTSGHYKYPEYMAGEQQCPEGYACSDCFAAPTMCPRGYYSNAGATACTLCEAGYKCPSPYGSMREACSSGYYATAGSLNCYPVPSHMIVANTASRPTWCAYGQVSMLTAITCDTCAVDFWCPGDNVTPLDCDNQVDETGTDAHTSKSAENNCFAKTATRGGTNSVYTSAEFDTRVVPGKYAMTGGTKQYDCPNGRECLFPMENIFAQCPPGYYDADGFFSCQPCPEGKVCPTM